MGVSGEPCPDDAAESLELMKLAEAAFTLVFDLMAGELSEGRMQSDFWPHRWAGALHEKVELRQQTFAARRQAWETLCAAELAAQQDKELEACT